MFYGRRTLILRGSVFKKQMIKKLALLLGATAILVSGVCFMPGIRYLSSDHAYAGFIIRNTAGLSYSDNHNGVYVPVTDTADIKIVRGPDFVITKDVVNLVTGETSSNLVYAFHGDTAEFIITIENIGDDLARNSVIADSIPNSTTYVMGSAVDTNSLDPLAPPDTISFQHMAGGDFDLVDTGTVTAIKWQWDNIDGTPGNTKRVVRFKVKVQ